MAARSGLPAPGDPRSKALRRSRSRLTVVAPLPKQVRRVLVVDDSVDTAHGLAMLLTAYGHKVRVAHEGLSALLEAQRDRPDVVVMDIGLPGLSGFEIAARMRQHPAMKDVVLVAMTGYGRKTDRRLSQAVGFDYHLVKPPDFDELQQVLSSARRA